MDLRKVKTLIDLVQQSDITELEITEGEERIRISRGQAGTNAAPCRPVPGPKTPPRLAPGARLARGAGRGYIRAMTDKTGPVRAEGKVVHVGGQVGIAEGRITDAAGKLYAFATTTCLVFDL